MSNFNTANELASNLIYGTGYQNNEPIANKPKRLVFVRSEYEVITETEMDGDWAGAASQIHALLNHGYYVDWHHDCDKGKECDDPKCPLFLTEEQRKSIPQVQSFVDVDEL